MIFIILPDNVINELHLMKEVKFNKAKTINENLNVTFTQISFLFERSGLNISSNYLRMFCLESPLE